MPQRSPDIKPRPVSPRRAGYFLGVRAHACEFHEMEYLQTQLCDLAASFARALPSDSLPSHQGRRECQAPDAPDSRVCDGGKQKAHALVRSHRNHPAFPAQWFYGLFRALPGDRAFLPPSSPEKLASQELDASVGASGPHDFAVRLTRHSSKAHQRPPHPVPRP
jgi:hypothetical protein